MKYLKAFVVIVLISGLSSDLKAQKKHTVFLEAYLIRHDFSEGLASINYELQLGDEHQWLARIGLYPDFESTISFPLTISRITRSAKRNHFEFGLGIIYRVEVFEGETYTDIPAIVIPLMLRRISPGEHLFYRLGVNLFISWPTLPSPSASIGYRF